MDEPTQKPKRRFWWNLLLGVSLALNLLVIGVVAGAAWRIGGPGGPPGAGGPPSGLSMLRALEHEDRKAVLRAARASKKDQKLDRRAHQAELLIVLRRDPFDPAELDMVIARQHADAEARLTAVSQAWRQHIVALPHEARVAYALRLETIMTRKGSKSDRKGD